jgi:hypothetical protein
MTVAKTLVGQSNFNDITGNLVFSPLAPGYLISEQGSATLSVCYNWSCNNITRLQLSTDELAEVKRYMDACAGDRLFERLQRLRIGVWRMEVLVKQHIPELANDLAVNDQEYALNGRTDCVDNATNTTTFLSILSDLGVLQGWAVGKSSVRDRLTKDVHWTATVIDEGNGRQWAVDSWFRPHGHLPFVSPLSDWAAGRKPWEPPLSELNPYPRLINDLCSIPGEKMNTHR